MHMLPFFAVQPEIAEKELLTIKLTNHKRIPNGTYLVVEYYCQDPDCNCQQVICVILSDKKIKIMATIHYCWETQAFYQKWSGDKSCDHKGPFLDPLDEQSNYADDFLKLFKERLNSHPEIADRFKSHYELLRTKLRETAGQKPPRHKKATTRTTKVTMIGEASSSNPWHRVYALAHQFNLLQPWTFINVDTLIGVQDPVTQDMNYCCILGELGEVFALMVYQGNQGLTSYRNLQGQEADAPMFNFFEQYGMILSFENRTNLSKKDKQQLDDLKLTFKGKKCWPQFRTLRPGYVEMPLAEADHELFATILEQVFEVLSRIAQNQLPEEALQNGKKILARVFENSKWVDRYIDASPKKQKQVPVVFDEMRAQRLSKSLPQTRDEWECTLTYMMTPIHEKGSKYLPKALLFSDHKTGMLFSPSIENPDEPDELWCSRFMDLIENMRYRPSTIYAGSKAYSLVYVLAKQLKIKIIETDDLPSLNEFLEAVSEKMNQS